MRIHGDTITNGQIAAAAACTGVDCWRREPHGSRKRDHAFDVILAGRGRTGTRYGHSGHDYVAATWDEWGIFLEALFKVDSTITVPGVYVDREHFRWATGARFDELAPEDQHMRHRWERRGTNATDAYAVAECSATGRCDALTRTLLGGRTWAEFAGVSTV